VHVRAEITSTRLFVSARASVFLGEEEKRAEAQT
jgi:hypothetical protein